MTTHPYAKLGDKAGTSPAMVIFDHLYAYRPTHRRRMKITHLLVHLQLNGSIRTEIDRPQVPALYLHPHKSV